MGFVEGEKEEVKDGKTGDTLGRDSGSDVTGIGNNTFVESELLLSVFTKLGYGLLQFPYFYLLMFTKEVFQCFCSKFCLSFF